MVPGAVETAAWLNDQGIAHRFVTNTSSRPRSAIVAKLTGLGIDVTEEEILTPAVAAVAWLRQRGLERPATFVPEATMAEFADLDPVAPSHADTPDGVGAVVIGDLAEQWNYATLNQALRLLMNDQAPPLLALGMTRYWRAEDGLRLDAGAFVRALEYAADTEAVVLGKPDRSFFSAALEALGVEAAETAMVGDDVRVDVAGAQRSGLRGVLVRTGKFSPGDLFREERPDAVLDSIADLPAWWT